MGYAAWRPHRAGRARNGHVFVGMYAALGATSRRYPGNGALPVTIDLSNEAATGVRYAYKASLIGSAHQFELTDAGLSWQVSGRSGVWPYRDIASIRLSYRPMSMQS